MACDGGVNDYMNGWIILNIFYYQLYYLIVFNMYAKK